MGKRGQRIAPRGRQPRREVGDGGRVLGTERCEELRILAVAADAGARGDRAVDADVAEVEMQPANARRSDRRQEQTQHLDVAGNAGLAEELGADLHDFARRRRCPS